MKSRIISILTITTLLTACSQQQREPMIAAGYITADSSNEVLRIEGDTIGVKAYAITDETEMVGGAAIEGNIAEVIYLPSEEVDELPQALTITTDASYPKALGRWQTEAKAQLQVDIELLVRGEVRQHLPEQTLRYTGWQLTGEEDEIILRGVISLPPEVKSKEKRAKKGEEEDITPPQRRERHFEIKGRITKISDSNTESRRAIVLRTDKGRESILYYKE